MIRYEAPKTTCPTYTVFYDTSEVASESLLAGYVAEAQRLVDCLNAYDGYGIPSSDAQAAFALLRKIARGEPANKVL